MKITKEQLRQIIREEQAIVIEDSRKKEMGDLKKNIEDDKEHLEDLEQDIKDDEKEEERDRKDEALTLNKTTLQEIIHEEVVALLKKKRLREAVDKKEQLRQAIEMWMTDTGFEPTDRVDLEYEAKKAAKTPRPKDRHPAFSAIMGIGGPWGTGPELEAAIKDISYKIMGEEKPERAPQPEDKETPGQRRSREKAVRSIDRKMGGRYR